MKKILLIIVVMFLSTLHPLKEANALLIFKFDVVAGEVTTAFTKFGEKMSTFGDKIMGTALGKQVGKGIDEAKKWKKNNYGNMKSFVKRVKEVKDTVSQVKADVYDKNLAQIKAINSDISAVKKRKETITAQLNSIDHELNESYNAEKAVIEGKINTVDMNSDILQKAIANSVDPAEKAEYEDQLELLKMDRTGYQQELDSLKEGYDAERKSAKSQLEEELKAVAKDLEKLYADLKALIDSATDDVNSKDVLLTTRDTYFIKVDENESPEKMEAIRINRLLNRRRSNVATYQTAVEMRDSVMLKNNEAEDWGYSGASFDTTAGAVGAMVEVQNKQVEALRNYTRVLISDLKMQTANDISQMTFYKLKKPEKDITKFNLDDYVYSPSSKDGGKS